MSNPAELTQRAYAKHNRQLDNLNAQEDDWAHRAARGEAAPGEFLALAQQKLVVQKCMEATIQLNHKTTQKVINESR